MIANESVNKSARKKSIVYAKGGGHGHMVRGLRIAQWLRELGDDVELVLREDQSELCSDFKVGHDLNAKREDQIDRLFIDTFPAGWKGELNNLPQSFSRSKRFLISRFNKDLEWNEKSRNFHTLLSPYPEAYSEWPKDISQRLKFCGWIAGKANYQYSENSLVILDPEKRFPTELLNKLKKFSFDLKVTLILIHQWDQHTVFHASKILVVGAGYNTFYEWIAANADVRFLPLARKWDDQHQRAEAFKLELKSFSSFLEWLEAPVQALEAPHELNFSSKASFESCL